MQVLKLLVPAIFLSACGGTDNNGSASGTSAKEQSQTEETVDLNAKSSSKGIGKFTSITLAAVDKGMAEKGETIFLSKCAVCHKTTDEKLIGPGLKGVTQRREPEWIMNMIVNAEEMEQKDEVAKALRQKYSLAMPNQGLSDEETRQVLEYLRENDGS